jgi:16S rRNA (uracil1498-N3)-methyltransferase
MKAKNVFFHENFQNSDAILPEEESRHCVQVLRHEQGDKIQVFDGKGHVADAVITQINKRGCHYSVQQIHTYTPPPFHTHLAIAPTKNQDRMEWMVEKLMEIGVHALSFLVTQHSERKSLRMDRLEKKVISALKQSKDPFRLQLHAPQSLDEFLKRKEISETDLFVAYVSDQLPYLMPCVRASRPVTLLIGPEGDFSRDEITQIESVGGKAVSLGRKVLRTETAGLLACQFVNIVNEY